MLLSGSLGGDKSALPNAHEQNAVGPGHLGLVSARSGSRRKQPNSSLRVCVVSLAGGLPGLSTGTGAAPLGKDRGRRAAGGQKSLGQGPEK